MLRVTILPTRRLRRWSAYKIKELPSIKVEKRAKSTMPIAPPAPVPHRPEQGRLFEQQSKLQKLPVPDLNATLARYMRSLEPILTPTKFAKSKKIIEEFGNSEQGKELQRRLVARASDPNVDNWLEEWWNSLSYMGYRDPVIPYVSYYYSFNDDARYTRPNQRAAVIICGATTFRDMVVSCTLEPEMQKTDPLCSHSYKFMFNTCRIPEKPIDYCRTVDYNNTDHVTIVRNSQFFSLPLAYDGRRLTAREIELVLDRIVEEADSGVAVPVGILTSDNRDSWATNRKLLLRSPQNVNVLDDIESSMFLVSLERATPVTREEIGRATWHGDGRSRWFDKPCQFTVFDNARAGICGEHSMMDGTPTLRLSDFVIEYELTADEKAGNPREDITYRRLQFITPPDVVAVVRKAEKSFDEIIKKQKTKIINYRRYGKEGIKKLRCSPDAYVQMVIQLAYSRMFGCVRPTYESSMTRKYLHGRTETCRSVSVESKKWCEAMASSSVSDTERVSLLRKAITNHSKLTKEAIEGQGVDRHLLGLRMSLHSNESKPKIFSDPSYAYSSHWYVSTSQISSENFTAYGWSEVVPDGFGVAYMILKESLYFQVSWMEGDAGLNGEHMIFHLEKAADDVCNLLSRAG